MKFDSSQKCWVTVANNSIVNKCWTKCWVVRTPQPTSCMRSPIKKSRAICILIVVPSLKGTAPSQPIQIITSIEMLDKMLAEMLNRLNRPLDRTSKLQIVTMSLLR